MKLKFTFVFTIQLFVFCLISNAQIIIDTTINDDFTNPNTVYFPIEKDDVHSSSVEGGFYKISHLRNEKSWAFWQKYTIDFSKDYTIETKIKQTSEPNQYGLGLIYDFVNWNNYQSFVISDGGYVNISKTVDAKYEEPQPWKIDEIVSKNDFNVLKIEKKSDFTRFFVNNKMVFEMPTLQKSVFGGYVGFIIYAKKDVLVDYIRVSGRAKKINLVSSVLKGYKKESLGSNINTSTPDLGPVISPDGNTLYFFRKKHPLNIGGEFDDIWYSEFDKDAQTWSLAKNIGFPINNSGHNLLTSVSTDNNKLYLVNTYNKDGSAKSIGLSISQRTQNGWAIPSEIKIKNYYNNYQYVNYALSADTKYLLLGIQRKDTKGGSDIYVSFKDSDTTYTEPLNLGSVVNTSSNDITPFLAADNKTLYYSTDGLAGFGSNDIFVTERLDDTWQNWSEPKNLGREVNSDGWEAYFTLAASGEYGYLVSSENQGDIVRIKLQESAKPKPVVLVKGKVFDKKTNKILSSTIHYFDQKTNIEVGSAVSNPSTGDYNIILQAGIKYTFRAEKEGYYAINDYLDLKNLTQYKEVTKNLYLVPIEVGQVVRLNNVFFDLDKSVLKSESFSELDRLVDFLKQNPQITIEIGGHTDNQGVSEYNLNLSKQRVESVYNYLIKTGISPKVLKTKGYGKEKPLVSNSTEEGRAQNRRVEFTILSQ